ncbi:MAG: hypothetical protein MJ189_02355, partial [Coriobacteriales bacterium]|nr:hypothetical protein [Coriobacteriales bacterium]
SEQKSKQCLPGVLNVKRFINNDGIFVGDMIFDENSNLTKPYITVDPMDETRRVSFDNVDTEVNLLQSLMKSGNVVNDDCDIHKAQTRCIQQLNSLDDSIKRLLNPHEYPAGVEKSLIERRNELVYKMRGISNLR